MLEKLLTLSSSNIRHKNLSRAVLVEKSVEQGAKLTHKGALCVWTGERTGRSPRDRFFVERAPSKDSVCWGRFNQPAKPESFRMALRSIDEYFRGKDLYRVDAYVGADERYGHPVKIITERPSHALFANLIFRDSKTKTRGKKPITVIAAPGLTLDPSKTELHSDAGVLIDLDEQIILVFGSAYAGEVKKSVFTTMNYLMPKEGVFPMHCSSNVGEEGDVALFFGLSGTGKTSLSADSNRHLLGDDEHGWSDEGVFNFEGGSYAKLVDLDEENEPEIWNALRFGALLENVSLDDNTRVPDYTSQAYTENTRGTYPLEHNPLMLESGKAGHPRTVFFLVADAFGVMPPIAKLTTDQAMFYFLTGYTAKLAGTEVGTTEPEATFSACFGEPFLPLSPRTYADLLKDKLKAHKVSCFLVNTGWFGGSYGKGKRIPIKYTKAMVRAASKGLLDEVPSEKDPVFGLNVPKSCPGVPSEILAPKNSWESEEEYEGESRKLAGLFSEHVATYRGLPKAVIEAGPSVRNSFQ